MTEGERQRAFRKEQKQHLTRLVAAHRAAALEAKRILEQARGQIAAELASATSEFQAWQLPNIQNNISRALENIGDELAAAGIKGATLTHTIGAELVERSLAAGGLAIAGRLPDVDLRQLMAIRTFMTDRLKNVTAEVASRVNAQIGLVMVGAQSTSDAVGQVAALTRSGRGRAVTILRTEMGRAFSVASQERMDQASAHVPGIKKQWRRSGKIHSRIAHDLADGQIVGVNESFRINGHEMAFPRDPKAPASETVNCGCVSLPYMEKWDVAQPGRQPFSDQEIFNNPQKRDLARELNPPANPASPGRTSIDTLQAIDPAVARVRIADSLKTPSFRNFAMGRGDGDHHPVAVMPADLAGALGADARIVRLSSYTVIKQRAARRGQAFAVEDYARAQTMLDKGLILHDGKQNLISFVKDGDNIWRGVFKSTIDRSELFLTSLHRTTDRQLKRLKERHRIIREG